MNVTVEQKVVQKSGRACIGWTLGRGYVNEVVTIKYRAWCVVVDGKTFAQCKSQKAAETIRKAMKVQNTINEERR